MTKHTRKESRLPFHDYAPHGPGSSRAIVTTERDALRNALYQDFDEKTCKRYRTSFARFLHEHYDIPMKTAYDKLHNWRVEEWEAYGLVGMITQYCVDNDIDPPEWPAHGDNWQQSVNAWLAGIYSRRMDFYRYMCERGMCRTYLRRLIDGKSTITRLQLVGFTTAFERWRRHGQPSNTATFVPFGIINMQRESAQPKCPAVTRMESPAAQAFS